MQCVFAFSVLASLAFNDGALQFSALLAAIFLHPVLAVTPVESCVNLETVKYHCIFTDKGRCLQTR